MKRLTAITALLLAAAPLHAQTGHDGHGMRPHADASVADVWEEFETSCNAALSDPQGFVTTHPVTNAQGVELIARSPDNQVVVLYNWTATGVFRQIELIGMPGELQILCDVHGGQAEYAGYTGEQMSHNAKGAVQEQELRALVAARPDMMLVGGKVRGFDFARMMGVQIDPAYQPEGRIFGIRARLGGQQRYFYGKIESASVSFIGAYTMTAEEVAAAAGKTAGASGNATANAATGTAAATAKPAPQAAANAMRQVAEICLRSYRDPKSAPGAIEAIGLPLSAGFEPGSLRFAGKGIHGWVTPGAELQCNIQSSDVPLDKAQAIGTALVQDLFPGKAQVGAPEGGNGDCDGYSIFATRQLIWLRYAQAGNSGECINDGSSAIIIN